MPRYSISRRKAYLPTVVVASMFIAARSASADVVTDFGALPLGTQMSGFTDPATGVTFSDPSSTDGNTFGFLQQDASTNLPNMTPGTILVGDPTSTSIADDFTFTMNFPTPIDELDLDMAYAVDPGADGSIVLEGFDNSGNLVDSFDQSFSSSGIQEDDISFTPAAAISSVTIVPTSISDGFNNISFQPADAPAATDVPEPAAVSLLAISTVLLGRRGSRKVKVD
jgi:hypothetical protein